MNAAISANPVSQSSLNAIKSIALDAEYVTPFIPKKAALLFINSYESTNFSLGEGPCNDGITMKTKLEALGYSCYVYYDVEAHQFIQLMLSFTHAPFDKLVVYFSGHGSSVKDISGDEVDGRDEALVFKDASILDDDLRHLIKTQIKNLILLIDCCHSGSVFDLSDEKNVLLISAANDDETAKQTRIERKEQGVFTYYFWKLIDTKKPIIEIKDKLNSKLTKYKQRCVISGGCVDAKL